MTELDDPVRAGYESSMKLQRLFTCMAETKEARALHNYASARIELCELHQRIASAISRGKLQDDFYSQLREWTK